MASAVAVVVAAALALGLLAPGARATDQLSDIFAPEAMEAPEPVVDTFGTEYPRCQNRCSGHGICEENVCHCARGWQGSDCGTETCRYECKNGGRCEGRSCVCAPGYSGVDCSLAACPSDCSNHGLCIDGTCSCLAGFTGPACDITAPNCPGNCSKHLGHGECVNGVCYCHDSWAGESCHIHVCTSSCSGHGTCVDDGISAHCQCDVGYAGADCSQKECPTKCSEHGTCNSVTGECSCNAHWEGIACDIPQCHPTCGDHGICKGDANTVSCHCDDGWTGLDCTLRQCPNNCSHRGECDITTGRCACPPHYQGADCSFTAVGNKHMRGCQSRAECSDHGLCVNTHCKCMDGFFGDRCQHRFDNSSQGCPNGCSGMGLCNYQAHCICVFPAVGADCADIDCEAVCAPNQRCVEGNCVCKDPSMGGSNCDRPLCPNGCSHHGICHTNNGSCACDEGYVGEACATRRCRNDCSEHGLCAENFTCVCHAGWTGEDCGERACPGLCGGHGVCDVATGKCACEQGFWGRDCSLRRCPDQLCSGHGTCINGTCECNFGWTGDACENRTCPRNCNFPKGGVCTSNMTCRCHPGYYGVDCFMIQPMNVSCPNQCSSHGHCVSQACVCEPGWTGEACEIPVCAERCHDMALHGVCNASRVCECVEGYSGLHCERVMCPHGCSTPHGYCNTTSGQCVCAPGHAGIDCAQPDYTHLANCSGHGSLDAEGSCKCVDGWKGFRCEERRCPDDCSGQGMCANGTCICKVGFEGSNCGYGSEKSNYKHNCDRRCAQSCIPRCKHVHPTNGMYEHYKHLDTHTGMLDPPCVDDLEAASREGHDSPNAGAGCQRPSNNLEGGEEGSAGNGSDGEKGGLEDELQDLFQRDARFDLADVS